MKTKRYLCLLLTLLLTLAAVMAAHADESMPDTITADTISLEDIFSFLASVDDNSADSGELLSEGTWIYNEFHQPVAVENLPTEAPMILPYVMPKLSFEWDDQDRMVKMEGVYSMDLEDIIRAFSVNMSEDAVEKGRELFVEFTKRNECEITEDDEWLLQELTISLAYDDTGRLVSYTEDMFDSRLYAYMRTGEEHRNHNSILMLDFDYSDPDYLTITPTMKNLDNGEVTHSQAMNLIQVPITYNAEGLPIRVMETDTDIYEQLDFQVTSVQVGNYGYFLWPDPDVSNTELPELYRAGILGLPFDKTDVTMGKVFTLKIEGVTDSGEQAVFYVQPDPMGRFMGFELIDGHCTRWPLPEVNPEKRYQITVDE